jgi:putative redox protein
VSVLKATARRVDNGLRQEIDVGGKHAIVTDEPARLGGTDAGPTPHELLPAALAACIATMIAMYARTKDWDLGEFSVEVEYDNEAVPRRFKVDVLFPCALSAVQLARLRRVADTCPLRRALETGFEFDERILAEEALELAPTG